MDTFRITVGAADEEDDEGSVDLARVAGLRAPDLQELAKLLPGARLSVEAGSVGKGASGPGATLVIEAAERIFNDGASLLAWGTALLAVTKRLRANHNKHLNLDEPRTIAAHTAAQQPALQERLTGSHYVTTVCLTGGGPGLGTDPQDVWVSSFATDDGWLIVLFSSPTGTVLGHAFVPIELIATGLRTPEDIRRLVQQAQEDNEGAGLAEDLG